MKSISSRQNPWFKRVRDAVREHAEEIAIEGPKAVEDAIAAGWQPIIVVEFSEELRRAVGDTKTSQGVFGLFHRPPSRFAQDRIVAALDGVQDPGNVGTIVRLAAAFDAGVALLPGCADPFSPKAIRASAGAILSVPIAAVTAQALIDTGRPLLYADARGEAFAPPKNAIVVLGSEGQGVSEAIRERGTPVGITTSGRVESLNVAAAAAILLWQAFR
ncbi:MAG TPA: RNA methyltransferase [Thermoanaerobaculia bacterium]|nr:RNA methyltransferase [Thermoanaerobaculia bacterium]